MISETLFTLTGIPVSQVAEKLAEPFDNPAAYKGVPGGADLTDIGTGWMIERTTQVFGLRGLGWKLLGWEILKSERQRLNEDHEGQRFPLHTLAVLIFAMHARFRGWSAAVLPDLGNVTNRAKPDVVIERAKPTSPGQIESFYVEVELSRKDLPEKWLNLVNLQGQVAICARNSSTRDRLVSDCKLKNIHGMATDLEVLIAPSLVNISADTPLWDSLW